MTTPLRSPSIERPTALTGWLILTALLIDTAGCVDSRRAALVGAWDMVTSEEHEEGSLPDDQQRSADAGARLGDKVGGGESGRLRIEFRGDGTLITETSFALAGSQKTGTWRLVSSADQPPTYVVRCELAGESIDTTIEFLDSDTIQMVPPNLAALDTELLFRRDSD